jgi:hypothetical protein
MRVDIREKVRERMVSSEDTTLVIKREADGKMRVTSRHWEDRMVLLKNEVLYIDGRLHVAQGGPARRTGPSGSSLTTLRTRQWDRR